MEIFHIKIDFRVATQLALDKRAFSCIMETMGEAMKKKFKTTALSKILVLGILLLALFSCGSKGMGKEASYDSSYNESAKAEAKANNGGAFQNFSESSDESIEDNADETYVIERKLIKRGHIEFESKNIDESKTFLAKLVKKHKAYISEENEVSGYSRIRYSVEIRIPKDNFDSFLAELSAGVEKFDHKNISVEDVTEEFIDINARLKIKKETEAQYLALLKQAKTVKDVLEVQNQLQMLRSDIESIEGRLKYLTKQVNFSTLNIDIYQVTKQAKISRSILGRIWDSIKTGGRNFFHFILFLFEYWFIFVLIILGIFIIRRLSRKKKQNKYNSKKNNKTMGGNNE